MPIRTVVVGAGRMGRNHVRTVMSNPRYQLVGIVDPIQPTGLSAPWVPDLRDLDVAYDAAIVAVPTPLHYELGCALLGAGKHVLLEKPIASTAAQARHLVEIARGAGSRLAVGHIERFNPAVQKLTEVIASGLLGTPIHYSFTRVGGYPSRARDDDDVVLELAVHDIDVFTAQCGPCDLIAAQTHATRGRTAPNTATLLLRSHSGVSADLHTNWITPTKIRQIRVTGTTGVCFVDYILQTCELLGGNLLQRRPPSSLDYQELRDHYANADKIHFGVTSREPLVLQLEDFAAFIERGEVGRLCLGDTAAATVAIAEAVPRAAEPAGKPA